MSCYIHWDGNKSYKCQNDNCTWTIETTSGKWRYEWPNGWFETSDSTEPPFGWSGIWNNRILYIGFRDLGGTGSRFASKDNTTQYYLFNSPAGTATTGSLTKTFVQPKTKIKIESNLFDITDINSVYKTCDNQCPPGTDLECTCNNLLCCYKLSSNKKSYNLIKSINL